MIPLAIRVDLWQSKHVSGVCISISNYEYFTSYTNVYRDHQTYKDIGQKLKAIDNLWTRQEHGLNTITKMLQYVCVCITLVCVQSCVFKYGNLYQYCDQHSIVFLYMCCFKLHAIK